MAESPITADTARTREWRRTLAGTGATLLGLLFLTGYLPARRDVRTLSTAEEAIRGEIRMLDRVNDRLRREIRAAREDPAYVEALWRARATGGMPGDPATADGWRVPTTSGDQ